MLYATINAAVKKIDRFEIEKPKFAVIDLAQKKITKTYDFPKEHDTPFGFMAGYRVSPDGKLLAYVAAGMPRNKIRVTDFSGRVLREITVAQVDFFSSLNWTADGKSWLAADRRKSMGTQLLLIQEFQNTLHYQCHSPAE